MSKALFDMELRAQRRDRAFRHGPELFLHERAFEDILDRLSFIPRRFGQVLLVGCPDADWIRRVGDIADHVDAVDPGPLFADAAGGACMIEDSMSLPVERYDLCVATGTLDTVDDLPTALHRIRLALRPDSLLIGALAGGDSLPHLRAAMRVADQVDGAATPHVHPRIEAPALAALLSGCGFSMPVIDVDQVRVAYASMWHLVRDLRCMGETNILRARSRKPLSPSAAAAAAAHFEMAGGGGKTIERFDLLHFAAWTVPSAEDQG